MAVWFFIFGLLCGSFANAVIWRIKVGKSVAKGRSMCPSCRKELAPLDLVPVLSWVWLRGKCRYCQAKISVQYPLVELLTAGLFLAFYLNFQPGSALGWFELAFWLYISVSLVILAVYDLKWMILPDVVLIPAIIVAVLRLPILLALGLPFSVAKGPFVAAFAMGGVFYAMAAVSKGKWMGGGDIKLVFLIGLLLGIQKGGVALFLATTVAALIGGTLLLLKKLHSRYVPFGPFLAAATIFSFFYGHQIIAFYLALNGLDYLTF